MKGADGTVSLEPAGQLELSGAPLENLHETCAETGRHLEQVKAIGSAHRQGVHRARHVAGQDPRRTAGHAQGPLLRIMMRHMPRVGNLGLDMMLRTCTIQVNLDYESEADMVRKFRVGLALQPLATALFANSPFTEGKPNGYLSFRSHIWSDTDPAPHRHAARSSSKTDSATSAMSNTCSTCRCISSFAMARYIDAAGQSFRDFLKGELPALPGERPRMSDWNDHLSTAFPEVRLKSFLEMRGADGGPWNRICALPALWVGLLYDRQALDAAWDLVRHWSMEEREALRNAVPKLALDAPLPGGGTLRDIAADVLEIARSGLAVRARLNASGDNETGYLEPLNEIVATGKLPAERLLDLYHGEWGGNITRVYEESF